MSESSPMITRRDLMAGAALLLASAAPTEDALADTAGSAPSGLDDWRPVSPRDEIRPEFSTTSGGGPDGGGCLVIRADARPGLDGAWTRSFPVTPGKHYRFTALHRATNVD